MRNIKSFLILGLSLLAFSCSSKEEKVEPSVPKSPVIESAELKGPDGETEILAGTPVKFTAKTSVEGSELARYSIEIRNGGITIGSAEGELSGRKATIKFELKLDVNPVTLEGSFYPDVHIKVVSIDDMYGEKTLTEAENVKISSQEVLDAVYLIDSNGKVYTMNATAIRGKYHTVGKLDGIGTSFRITTKLDADGTPDPSGQVWGEFQTPVAESHSLRWIGFDIFSGQISKMIDYTVTLDYSMMAKDGDYSVFWSLALVRDCRVVFLNYPNGMKLQPDRFDDVSGNTARYTGQTGDKFEIYFVPDTKWLVVKNQWNDTDALWVTGMNASQPMQPYDVHQLNWFESGKVACHSAVSFVKDGADNWHVVLYLDNGFTLKVYDAWAWANELLWTSDNSDIMKVTKYATDPKTGKTDGNYGVAGENFTPGLYMLRFNKSTEHVVVEPYVAVLLHDVNTGNSDPEPGTDPGTDPGTVPSLSGLYLVDSDGHSFAMSLVSGSLYRTSDALGTIGNGFKFAEKVTDGAIDYSGAVYAVKDGAITKVDENGDDITLDACYAVYNKKPWQIGFDLSTKEVVYREGIWKTGMGDQGDGTLVLWVLPLPHNCEVQFFDFDKDIGKMVDKAIFDKIDETTHTARYIGTSNNFETYYRVGQGWLIMTNNIATDQLLAIGKNASFPQEPYTAYPVIETDIPRIPGQTLPIHKISDDIFRAEIYLDNDFAFYLYTDYAWGAPVNDWASVTPDLLVAHEKTYTYGTQNVENNTFAPGVYLLEFNKKNNTVSLTKR